MVVSSAEEELVTYQKRKDDFFIYYIELILSNDHGSCNHLILYTANLSFEFFPVETSTIRLSFSSKSSPRITCFSIMTLTLFSSGHRTAAKTILI